MGLLYGSGKRTWKKRRNALTDVLSGVIHLDYNEIAELPKYGMHGKNNMVTWED